MAAGHGRHDAVRRGRRESRLDAAAPVHRRAFAQRLRDLRAECHTPPYRVLSSLAHCATGTLSEAASGRRLPTWETTRAYVTGCLRHAGRDPGLAAELDRWRADWERAARAERTSYTPFTPRVPAPSAVPRARRGRRTRPLLFLPIVLLVILTVAGLRVGAPAGPRPMTGLFNVLLVAPARTGAVPAAADRLHALLEGDLRAWSAGTSAVQVRIPEHASPGDLGTLADQQNADVVLRPVLSDDGDGGDGGRSLTAVEIYLAGRTLGGTPEYAGVYRLGLLEPPGFHPGVTGDVRPAVLSYRNAVLSVVRGAGAYAYGDFAAAEGHFAGAGDELRRLGDAGERPVGRATADLLLGIARAARDPARAVEPLERAAAEDPRADVALGAALSALVRCDHAGSRRPGSDVAGRLGDADAHYERFLRRAPDEGPGLLDMTARYRLGRNAECQGRAGVAGAWEQAEREYAEVVRLRETTRLTGASARQAAVLADEARAAIEWLPR